jgi:parallel beta-helix repeat protein
MQRKIVFGIVLALLLIGMLTLVPNVQSVKAEPKTIVVPDDYPTIQEAINAASDGDIIFVRAGTYHENVVVNKTLSLVGENRKATVVDGKGLRTVINITANMVTVINFTIKNSGSPNAGIGLTNVKGCIISLNNVLVNDYVGILLMDSSNIVITENIIKDNMFGITLIRSSDNILSKNQMTANWMEGVQLALSDRNKISANYVANNGFFGIQLERSLNNIVSNNTLEANFRHGVMLDESSNNKVVRNVFFRDGLGVSNSYENVVKDNIVNGKPLVYLEGLSDHVVQQAGQVILINCSRIKVENLNLSFTSVAILLSHTNDTEISANNITETSWAGIWLEDSYYNRIHWNSIANNSGNGVSLKNASYNIVFRNKIIQNSHFGIQLLGFSNQNVITENDITDNNNGISLIYGPPSNNSILRNNIIHNDWYGVSLYIALRNLVSENNIKDNSIGIQLSGSNYTNITGNNIENNKLGIGLDYSSNNTISGNDIINNEYGMRLFDSTKNVIYHNNFINNTYQIFSFYSTNAWDDGYPSGGNYWSDYEERYPDAKELDDSGIWDTPYVIDENNQDNYPLTEPWSPPVLEDTTPPVTTISLEGTLGNNGWYTSDVTVTLSATDDISGVDKTEYSFDGSTWFIYDTSFVITAEGVTTIYYRSSDVAGNIETTRRETVKIDKTASTITVTLSAPAYGVTYTQADTLTLTYTATDPISGLASINATLDDEFITSGESISLLWFSLGTHTIIVRATDNAGNIAEEVVTFEIIATLNGLKAMITQLTSLGLIDNSQGIDISLMYKLSVAQRLVQSDRIAAKNVLNAFINEVQAQSGKHITTEAANILIKAAEYIIAHP